VSLNLRGLSAFRARSISILATQRAAEESKRMADTSPGTRLRPLELRSKCA
jgi:hypothetical protein